MAADNSRISAQVEQIAAALTRNRQMLATAESCTGGWIAKVLTDRAGSSEWFGYGVVSYSNEAKQELLGVAGDVIADFGAVSQETAEAMARGVRQRSGADWTVAVTGVAGPGGGSADKPVGTVWFAWCDPAGSCRAEVCRFDGDREAVRRQTVEHALAGIVQRLDSAET